jgi:hypothetical protein
LEYALYSDILEAEKVWTKTKEIVSKGKIVKEVIGINSLYKLSK